MIYFSDAELDNLLLEDIYRGDLTTRALNLGNVPARMQFKRKNAGILAGVTLAERLLRKLDLQAEILKQDGDYVEAMTPFLQVYGSAEKLHQGWKVVQCVLEWSCGVAQYTADMLKAARAEKADAQLLCTRKSIPGTRKLATAALLVAGGQIHRQGLSETLLVFTNHRRLLEDSENYTEIVRRLRAHAPENKITLEADDLAQFKQVALAKPDIIQVDKFSLEEVKEAQDFLAEQKLTCQISVAGGVNKNNIHAYAKLGIQMFISSAPYYAPPEDIKVVIEKAGE